MLKLVDEGGDFEALMEEYGEDPGMKNEAYKNGYLTYAGDTGFVTEFADACAALTLATTSSAVCPPCLRARRLLKMSRIR